jgi:hypothetical protein
MTCSPSYSNGGSVQAVLATSATRRACLTCAFYYRSVTASTAVSEPDIYSQASVRYVGQVKREAPYREIRRFPRLRALGIVLGILTAPAVANAAPPKQPTELHEGAYFQVSPGIAAAVVHERGFAHDARWAWPWSIGAGRMFTRGPRFKATVGASLEHRVFFIEDVGAHGVHALLESRIGAGSRRVWGFGLIGIGAAGTILDFGFIQRFGPDMDAFAGLALQFGGGVQALIGRRFFVGGELDLDLGYYFPDKRTNLNRFHYHTLTIELTLGWYF